MMQSALPNGSPIHVSGGGLLVPPELRDRDEPMEIPCCYGAAIAENRCTCWEPVYDLEQQPLAGGGEPGEIPTRGKCCHDCAYRNGSPERSDDRSESLDQHVWVNGEEFWCHQGVRRVIAFRHPDGRELPAGDGDYRPPVGPAHRPVVWKADGTVAERCAGWAALRRRFELSEQRRAFAVEHAPRLERAL